MMKRPGKNVCVLGLGITGFESARFLHERGFRVFVSESHESDRAVSFADDLKKLGISFELGNHSEEKILQSDWVLISPGIPPLNSISRLLKEKNKPVFSEIEVAGWYCTSPNVIAVTGTAGKTTVTTLLTRMLELSGKRAVCCGNIGNPWIRELKGLGPKDYVVVEVSSFQLKYCLRFKPRVAVLLNVSENHLDWHEDMTDYVRSKLKIFENQTPDDFALLCRRDREAYFPDTELKAKTVFLDDSDFPDTNLTVLEKVALVLNCEPSSVRTAWDSFRGIEHRMESFLEQDGVAFINDSKSTTPYSLEWGLKRFEDGRVVLIAGGKAKSKDFDRIRETIRRKVRHAVVIGTSADLLAQAWQSNVSVTRARTLEEAVGQAIGHARKGDAVLFSPACASFDMFRNYEDRGRQFKKKVCDYFLNEKNLRVDV